MTYKPDKKILPDEEHYGFKLRMREDYRDENVIDEIFTRDFYRMPEDPKVVIDIGANIGTFALLAARAGAKVYAFEPEASNYAVLSHNVEANGYQDRINYVELGVGKAGLTKLYVHPDNAGGTSAYLRERIGLEKDKYQMVDFITIHDVFAMYKINHCDVLKLDCEGSEVDIVRDMDEELAKKIGQVSIEIHDRSQNDWIIEKLLRWFPNMERTSGRFRTWVFKK